MNDAEELHDWLIYREQDIRDFGFRVYEGRGKNFLHRPQSDDDRKCAQVRPARISSEKSNIVNPFRRLSRWELFGSIFSAGTMTMTLKALVAPSGSSRSEY